MKDPLAPDTPYEHWHLSREAVPEEIKAAFYRFVKEHPEERIEATQMWDALRRPRERLLIDIFQYQNDKETEPKAEFVFELSQVRHEDIERIIQDVLYTFSERGKNLDFGGSKPILDVALE